MRADCYSAPARPTVALRSILEWVNYRARMRPGQTLFGLESHKSLASRAILTLVSTLPARFSSRRSGPGFMRQARSKLPILSLCAGLLGAFSTYGKSTDWPQWRGSGQRGVWEGVSLPDRLSPRHVETIWSVPIGGGYSGLSVVASRVFTMERPGKKAEKERVICFDRINGKRLWEHEYAAAYGDMDHGYGPRATPTVHGELMYTLGATGVLHCLTLSGEVTWSVNCEKHLKAKRPIWGHSASPLVVGDLLVLLIGARPGGTVVALDRRNGRERWRALQDRVGYSTPVLAVVEGKRQLIVWTPDRAHGLLPETGEVLWSVDFRTSNYDVSIISPVVHSGRLFLSGYWDGARQFVLSPKESGGKRTLDLAWKTEKPSALMSTPLLRGEYLYVLDKREGLLCIDWQTGETFWTDSHRLTPKERNPHASLVWSGLRAVALNAEGELVVSELSPKGYVEHGRAKIIDRTWAHPAFSGQEVFARDHRRVVRVRIVPTDE